jgi:hypothetical protein
VASHTQGQEPASPPLSLPSNFPSCICELRDLTSTLPRLRNGQVSTIVSRTRLKWTGGGFVPRYTPRVGPRSFVPSMYPTHTLHPISRYFKCGPNSLEHCFSLYAKARFREDPVWLGRNCKANLKASEFGATTSMNETHYVN